MSSEYHSSVEGITHSLQVTFGSKDVPTSESGLLLGPEVVADAAGGGDCGDVGCRVLGDIAILTVGLGQRALVVMTKVVLTEIPLQRKAWLPMQSSYELKSQSS